MWKYAMVLALLLAAACGPGVDGIDSAPFVDGGNTGSDAGISGDNGSKQDTPVDLATDQHGTEVGVDSDAPQQPCPPPGRPGDLIEGKINGQTECYPSAEYKACVESIVPGTYEADFKCSDPYLCIQSAEVLPSSFMPPTEQLAWEKFQGKKPIEYEGKAIVKLKIGNYGVLMSSASGECRVEFPPQEDSIGKPGVTFYKEEKQIKAHTLIVSKNDGGESKIDAVHVRKF